MNLFTLTIHHMAIHNLANMLKAMSMITTATAINIKLLIMKNSMVKTMNSAIKAIDTITIVNIAFIISSAAIITIKFFAMSSATVVVDSKKVK